MALTIGNGNPISFYDLNIAAGLSGTSENTSLASRGTTFGISYATNGTNSLQMCEFYTNGCPGLPPSTPTGFSASLSGGLTFNLSWNSTVGATSYKVFRDGVYNKTVSTTSTTGSGISYNTQYCWTVSAVNASGESSQTSQICVTSGASMNLQTYEMSRYGVGDYVSACDTYGAVINRYTLNGDIPYDGDIIYSNSTGTPFDGGDMWYWQFLGPVSFTVSSVGVVGNRIICDTGGGPLE